MSGTAARSSAPPAAAELWPEVEERLRADLPALAARFRAADPYPHVVLDDLLPGDEVTAAAAEFPGPEETSWIQYKHLNEDKMGKSDRAGLPPRLGDLVDRLNSPRMVQLLSELTGIPGLVADPDLEGGGLHQTRRGGFLNVHADYTRHPRKPRWTRRCNLILFLNQDWEDSWNGALELWDREMTEARVRVPPIFNRAVVFTTDADSFHGYPDPIRCPPHRTRRSVALYYFTVDEAVGPAGSTDYRARPSDSPGRRLLIRLDTLAVAVFSRVKRRLGLSDEVVGRWLERAFGLFRRDRGTEADPAGPPLAGAPEEGA